MAIGDASDFVSDLLPTFFGGNISNMTLDQIKRRQAVAAAIQAQKRGYPKNLGEGLTSFGEAIGSRLEENRLAAAENAYRTRRSADFGGAGLPGGLPGPGGVAPRPAAAAPVGAAPGTPGIPAGIAGRYGVAAAPLPGAQQTAAAEDDGGTSEDTKTRLAMALVNQMDAPGGAQANFTEGAAQPPLGGRPSAASADEGGDIWSARSNAIAGLESGGNYQALGRPTARGDRAYGKYQVMGANIPKWTAAALGESLTPQQFLASPEAQEAVFRHRFGMYVNAFGEEGAARAWFAGPAGVRNTNATDVNGMSVGRYGQGYLSRLGQRAEASPVAGQQYASLPPVTMTDAGPEPTPTDIPRAPLTVLAQAGGAGGATSGGGGAASAPAAAGAPASSISGPLTPAAGPPASAPATDFPARAADPRFLRAPDFPKPPEMPPITEYEKRGYALARKYSDDPEALAQAKMLIDYGAKLRTDAHARDVEAWKLDYARAEKEATAEAAYARGLPETEAKLAKDKLERDKLVREADAARRAELRTAQLGGLTPQQYQQDVIKPSTENNKVLSQAHSSIEHAMRILDSKEGIFSGAGANIALSTAKLKAAGGMPADPRIQNNEILRTTFGAILAANRTAIVGNQNISDNDMKIVERISGGDPTLEIGTIRDVLKRAQAVNIANAVNHQKRLARFGGGDQDAIDYAYNTHGLPMERIVPRDAVESLAANPTPERMEKFDQAFATPGLARRVLGR